MENQEVKTEAKVEAVAPAAVEAKEVKQEVVQTESKEVKTEPVVEAAPAVAEVKTEAKVETVVEAKTEVKTEVVAEAKVAEQTDAATSGAKVVLSEVVEKLRPFFLTEDVKKTIGEKDSKIAELSAKVEELEKKQKTLSEQTQKAVKLAKDLGNLYHFEKLVSESSDHKSIRAIIGDARQFSSHEHLEEAVKAADKKIKAVIESKTGTDEKTLKAVEESQKKVKELEEANATLKQNLTEAVKIAKESAIRNYISEKAQGNPNKAKIMQLAESVTSKEQADKLIEQFAVGAPLGEEYNSIRRRLNKVSNTLVEDHVKQNDPRQADQKAPGVVAEGVEAEMAELFPGASLELVRDLGGVKTV